ncbi:GntR family transcriptional regulator [Thermopolyspora flexuosa]|jgi:GntR family transcriptional regulator|uniref:GntR family transcriptional regulator n=1 Tax=Thermopolyspora flexuosa TaxID=103836 RepID=A0A543J1W0_9ACTN|nr:GntR family transcriptional regulator [Thermopolyspora flexuosa]TQM76814.1 GntR family transcriptional regulator [Thermopolyspora flexuosa]GGM86964.1 GntR family transcriptional regulator [Thermopolyspora flexuosa]
MAQIDPGSPVPKYFQLREILLDLIERNELPIGSAIPSERELSACYGLSRMTVRQAVDHLVSEGRLHRVPGKGTFVARPKIEMTLQLRSFTEDMRARGMEPGARDLDRRVVRASPHLARRLGLRPGDEVHYLERLRTADGEPLCIERVHIPVALAPDLAAHDLTDRSLYALLESVYGIVFDAGELTIDAGIADPGDADLLRLPRGGAVLILQHRSFAGGVCAEIGVSTYRADRYQLRAAIVSPARHRSAQGRGVLQAAE